MLISHLHKFIYFAPQKTGTTSLHQILEKQFGAELLGEIHDIYFPQEYEKYYTFATVRNPYTRALSAYNYMIDRGLDRRIDQCCTIGKWHWARPIYSTLYDRTIPEGSIPVRVDSILRMESLDEDFNRLPFVMNRIELPRLNISEKHTFSYGLSVYEFVKRFYAEDFGAFHYSSDWQDFGFKVLL